MKKYIIFGLVALIMSSCAQQITRGEQYPKMYEEKPLSIVIMPPINQTEHVEAKDYFYTTLYTPLCEKGYYVYSPLLTMEMFQSESAYDAELFIEGDLSQFRNVLGADAAMFTKIKSLCLCFVMFYCLLLSTENRVKNEFLDSILVWKTTK